MYTNVQAYRDLEDYWCGVDGDSRDSGNNGKGQDTSMCVNQRVSAVIHSVVSWPRESCTHANIPLCFSNSIRVIVRTGSRSDRKVL